MPVPVPMVAVRQVLVQQLVLEEQELILVVPVRQIPPVVLVLLVMQVQMVLLLVVAVQVQ